MKITVQWFGGSSYSAPAGNEVEYFDSIAAAKQALWSRSDSDPAFPCVSDDSEMLVWFGTLPDVTDLYPDRRLFFGPRSGIRSEYT